LENVKKKHEADPLHAKQALTLNLLAPTTVGARINPYPANLEKMVSS